MEPTLTALYQAMLAHDILALDMLLADDVVYVHSTGLAETKSEFLNGIREGLYEYERVRPETQRIEQSGDLAMVYSILDFIGGARGKSHPPTRLITTLVWRREHGRWRMVVRQATRIP